MKKRFLILFVILSFVFLSSFSDSDVAYSISDEETYTTMDFCETYIPMKTNIKIDTEDYYGAIEDIFSVTDDFDGIITSENLYSSSEMYNGRRAVYIIKIDKEKTTKFIEALGKKNNLSITDNSSEYDYNEYYDWYDSYKNIDSLVSEKDSIKEQMDNETDSKKKEKLEKEYYELQTKVDACYSTIKNYDNVLSKMKIRITLKEINYVDGNSTNIEIEASNFNETVKYMETFAFGVNGSLESKSIDSFNIFKKRNATFIMNIPYVNYEEFLEYLRKYNNVVNVDGEIDLSSYTEYIEANKKATSLREEISELEDEIIVESVTSKRSELKNELSNLKSELEECTKIMENCENKYDSLSVKISVKEDRKTLYLYILSWIISLAIFILIFITIKNSKWVKKIKEKEPKNKANKIFREIVGIDDPSLNENNIEEKE